VFWAIVWAVLWAAMRAFIQAFIQTAVSATPAPAAKTIAIQNVAEDMLSSSLAHCVK
jgi:hypothetical protein